MAGGRSLEDLKIELSSLYFPLSEASVEDWLALGEPAVAELALFLDDESSLIRNRAIVVLARFGRPAFTVLERALKDRDVDNRRTAVVELSKLGRVAFPLLMKVLDYADPVAPDIIREFGSMGANAKEALPAVIAAVRCPYPLVCKEAILALGFISRPLDVVVPALVAELRDERLVKVSTVPGSQPVLIPLAGFAESSLIDLGPEAILHIEEERRRGRVNPQVADRIIARINKKERLNLF
jgi:HEAT repeat protein